MNYPDQVSKSYLIAELPVHERPRERLLTKGAEALSDIELLAILLRTGARGKSTLDVAKELLQRYQGDLAQLAAASPADLAQVRGIGKAKAAELKATFSLAARMANHIAVDTPSVDSPESAASYFREQFRGKKQEELRVLLLQAKNGVIRDELVTIGLLDRSQAHAREIFRSAIQYSAAKIIVAHNHPSGDPTPSTRDIECTKSLVVTGKVIGIELIDHIVFGTRTRSRDKDYYSFRENGLLD